jgi:hypothetical protein
VTQSRSPRGITVIEALADPRLLGALPAFRHLDTWRVWLVFLAALYGLPFIATRCAKMSEDEALEIFCRHTGRSRYAPPPGGFREAAAIVGRQAGKDRIASVVQAYEAVFGGRDADGEMFSLSISQDLRASLRTQLRYSRLPFEQVPMLRQLVRSERADSLELTTGVTLASYPCRPQSVRGIRAVVAVCSELAHFRSTEGYPTDVEMLRALRPTLATTNGRLIILSSPYAQAGALYELHRRHFGRDDSDVLLWRAAAQEMNPTLPADYLRRMEQDDPEAYRSEVLGEFRAGISTLFEPDAIQACVDTGVRERMPMPRTTYFSFVDAASGSGTDSFTCAIAHLEHQRAVVDVVRAWKPPFNPSGAIAECAELLIRFHLRETVGDRFAPGFVAEGFRTNGITYRPSDMDRSALYLELLPAVNARQTLLPDQPELLRELRGLERRRGNSGRDRVDHMPGAHDDQANACAGAVVTALKGIRRMSPELVSRCLASGRGLPLRPRF